MANRWGNSENSDRLYFLGFIITADGDCHYEIKDSYTLWKESYDQARQHIKKQRHYFANKGPSSQGYGFSSGHVWMWELDCEEGWAPKNWCFWTVVVEKTLESPLDCKEVQPAHPKGDQSCLFIGRTDVEAETSILWPPHVKTDSFEKVLMLGKIEGGKKRGQQRMRWFEWDHQLNGHEFEWTSGVGDGQGGLAYYSPWVRRVEHDWVTELIIEYGASQVT